MIKNAIITTLLLTVLPAAAQAQSLTGAGSTFINPIMTHWVAAYQKATGVRINYQSIGSGGGINALINHTVDFAGSDAPMNTAEMKEAGSPVIHLPAVIGAEAVAYNLPGVGSGLHLTGEVLAAIFLGQITRWNDLRVAALNPKVRLPNARIFVAHRSDGSGTTYIFTDYLSKISPAWKSKVGNGKSVAWPVGMGGKGNEGVAGLLKEHPDSIGYIELAYALQNRIPYAMVRNARGKYLYPSSQTASIAAEGAKLPADLRASLTNTNNTRGYPIVGFSWLIVRKTSTHSAPLKAFLRWVITAGQRFSKPLAYAPLPAALQTRELRLVVAIQ